MAAKEIWKAVAMADHFEKIQKLPDPVPGCPNFRRVPGYKVIQNTFEIHHDTKILSKNTFEIQNDTKNTFKILDTKIRILLKYIMIQLHNDFPLGLLLWTTYRCRIQGCP